MNLAKWELQAFGLDELAPGETLTLETAYDAGGNPFVQSGVLVEATVDGEQQLYGASGGSVQTGRSALQRPSVVTSAPQSGEGPSPQPIPVATLAVLVATGVSLIGSAQLLRKSLRR